MTTILDTALQLLDAGYSVIPIKNDGSKAPALSTWKRYTAALPPREEVVAWFDLAGGTIPSFDLGVVQGAVSGGAELTELEGRAAHRLPELAALAADTGLGNLWQRVASGWLEMSPSGGIHFHYRIADGVVPGNVKLARGADKLVLAETRGEGGQVVVAPSRHHASGKPWVRLAGGPTTAAVLTMAERDAFHALLRTLDEMPSAPRTGTPPPSGRPTDTQPAPASRQEPQPHQPNAPADAAAPTSDRPGTPSSPVSPSTDDGSLTPGDDFEARTDWADILEPHGWQCVTRRGPYREWVRPGKNPHDGISATTGHADDRDRLFVFTSSTDFQQEVPYTKLGAYALLNHGGDHAAAARELYGKGFGQRAEQARPTHDDLAGLIAPTAAANPSTPPEPVTSDDDGERKTPAVVVTEPSTYTETDDGNALRLVDTHAGLIRYVPQRGAWIVWDGARWRWDDAGHVTELARSIARDLPAHDKEARMHRRKSLSKRGVEAIVGLARTDHRVATMPDRLDANPYDLNTPAGIINLRTGTVRPADPAALCTRSTAVAPDFDAPHPRWSAFLAETFAGNPELADYVQRLLGSALVGAVLEQLMPLLFGASGQNGKSTLSEVVQAVTGNSTNGYSTAAPPQLVLKNNHDAHPAEIARLQGARLVFMSEPEKGSHFAEAKIKLLSGKDTLAGRFMGKDWFTFTPTHTLFFIGNDKPEVTNGGPAFWRRVRLVEFEHRVPDDKKIADLTEQLVEDEGPAILAWLIRGAANYFAGGMRTPASVLASTEAYQHESDTLARFVEDRCELGNPNAQHMTVASAALRAAYEAWCRAEGETPISAKALTQQLVARFGVRSGRSESTRYVSGIRLRDVSGDGDDPGDPWVADAFGGLG